MLIDLVGKLRFGILPVAGGWLDQTAIFADAANLLLALGIGKE